MLALLFKLEASQAFKVARLSSSGQLSNAFRPALGATVLKSSIVSSTASTSSTPLRHDNAPPPWLGGHPAPAEHLAQLKAWGVRQMGHEIIGEQPMCKRVILILRVDGTRSWIEGGRGIANRHFLTAELREKRSPACSTTNDHSCPHACMLSPNMQIPQHHCRAPAICLVSRHDSAFRQCCGEHSLTRKPDAMEAATKASHIHRHMCLHV